MKKFKPKVSSTNPDWYLIPGYEGYLANEDGYILNTKTGNSTLGGISDKYRRVSVYPTGAETPVLAYTHVLICTAFYGESTEGQVVLHIDNDRYNNAKKNLKWGTQSENVKQSYDDGNRGSLANESLRSMEW